MQEGTRTVQPVKGPVDEEICTRAFAAIEEAPPENRVRAGLQVMLAAAESDPVAARSALSELRTDYEQLRRIEAWLGGDPDRTTFALGAAIQVVDTELGSELPNLDSVAPAMLRWLEGDW